MPKRILDISFNSTIPNTLTQNFENFIIFKRAQGNCLNTEKQYRYHFGRFIKYCDDNLDMNNLKEGVIKIFSELNGKANVTYNMTYKYLHCFFNWCVRNGVLPYNPIISLGFKKKREYSKAIDVKFDIIESLLKSFNLKTYSGFRNYIIILITLDIGIRPCELLNISREDINFTSKHIKVREEISKTHEERILPISEIIVDLLQKLISVTPKNWNKYVFYTVDGKKLTSNRWTSIIHNQCKKNEIKLTAYGLRHIFAINFLRNKGNIFALQRLLGHTDLSMTKKYIALSQVDIDTEHTMASPVNNLIKRNTRVTKLFR